MHMQSFANGFIHGLKVQFPLAQGGWCGGFCKKKECVWAVALQKENLQLFQPYNTCQKKKNSLREKNTPKLKCHNFTSFRHVSLFPMRTLVGFWGFFFSDLMAIVKYF